MITPFAEIRFTEYKFIRPDKDVICHKYLLSKIKLSRFNQMQRLLAIVYQRLLFLIRVLFLYQRRLLKEIRRPNVKNSKSGNHIHCFSHTWRVWKATQATFVYFV